MKRFIALMLAFLMIFALAACGSQDETPTNTDAATGDDVNTDDTNQEPIQIRMSEASSSTNTSCLAQNYFKEILEERSNGRFEVVLYQDGQLGTENETWDMIQQGTLEMMVCGSGTEQTFLPEYSVTSACYVFDSYDQYERVFRDETVMGMLNGALKEAKDARVLWTWERGARNLTANKEIDLPEDIEGVKLRVPGTEIFIRTWEFMGAKIVSMSFNELYTALETGTCEAQENPVDTILASSLYEVQDYLMLTEHVYNCGYVVINDTFWNSLSAEDQDLLMECVKEAGEWNDEAIETGYADTLAQLEEHGMTIVEVDRNAWIEALSPLIDELSESMGWDKDFTEAVLAVE